jgi:hypothetical protein
MLSGWMMPRSPKFHALCCSLVLVGAFCFKLESSTMPLLGAFFFQKTKKRKNIFHFLKKPKITTSKLTLTISQALSTEMPRMWMNSSSGNGRSIMMPPPYSALHLKSVQPQTMNEVHLARSIARHGFKVHPFSQIIDGKSESGAVLLCSKGKSLESSLNVKVHFQQRNIYQQ